MEVRPFRSRTGVQRQSVRTDITVFEVMMARRWWLGATLVFTLSLSAHALAAERAPLTNVDPALEKLAKEMADENLPLAQRLEIVKVFGGWATVQVREPLLVLLKNPAPELRVAAARALG